MSTTEITNESGTVPVGRERGTYVVPNDWDKRKDQTHHMHRTSIHHTPTGWTGTCACGWTSEPLLATHLVCYEIQGHISAVHMGVWTQNIQNRFGAPCTA